MMLSWVIDHANGWYFLFVAAAFILLAAGWVTRRAKFWVYAAVPVGLAILLWLLGQFIVTDRKQIERNLDAMAKGVAAQKADDVFRHVSKDFRYGAMNRETLYKLVSSQVGLHKINDIFLWGQQTTVKGDTAETLFNFRANPADGRTYAASAKATFVREGTDWKLRELQIYELGTTKKLFVPGID